MLKWEKRLIEFLEKHMLILAVLLVSVIALYLRRGNIWYHTEDCVSYFDSHEGNIQSALYYLLVWLAGFLFELPLHGIKWIAGLADFGVASLAVCLCMAKPGALLEEGNLLQKTGRLIPDNTTAKIKLVALYTVCLFAPTIYVRGCVWAQIDSLAMFFLLGAVCFKEYLGKKGLVPAVALAAIGVALYPPFMLFVILYCLFAENGEAPCVKYLWLVIGVIAVVLELVSGLAIGISWQSGMQSFIRWTTWHPLTGLRYTEVGTWMWHQLLMFAYGMAVISLPCAFRKKIPYMFAIAVHLITMICFSVALGWQYSI